MSCTVCESGGDNVGNGDVLENSVEFGDTEDEFERIEAVGSPELLVVSKACKP